MTFCFRVVGLVSDKTPLLIEFTDERGGCIGD